MKKVLACLLFMIAAIPSFSQNKVKIERDTLFLEKEDTVLIESYAKRYDPRKALLYAAVLPGLGQVYNKKYWKLPLVYGGFFALGHGISYYNGIYQDYKTHLFFNLEHNLSKDTDINVETRLTTSQLRRIVDKARRERDFMVILMGGMYLLQIVDAHIDAHLKEFDLNPNLKARIEPTMYQDAVLGRQTGVAVIFRF